MTNKRLHFFLLLTTLTLFLPSCHVARYFYWNFADIRDCRKFPSVPVSNGADTFRFVQPAHPVRPVLPAQYNDDNRYDGLDDFLQDHKTVAFLVIRNDTLIMEKYFDGYQRSSAIPSFSMSKSFLSALTGIAINEGHIRSVDQPVTDFLPELLDNDSAFGRITIKHLLNMRSGIRFNEGYANPFADMAKYYYGRNLKKYIGRLRIEAPPGERYNYISVNSQLLGMAIEQATGMPLNRYLRQEIWKPLGMQYDASWSIDSKKHRQINAFCCINARPIDFAKLGRLYLNRGRWNGRQIVPRQWVETSTSIINDSRDSQGYPYTYNWRVKTDGAFLPKASWGNTFMLIPQKTSSSSGWENDRLILCGRNFLSLCADRCNFWEIPFFLLRTQLLQKENIIIFAAIQGFFAPAKKVHHSIIFSECKQGTGMSLRNGISVPHQINIQKNDQPHEKTERQNRIVR